MDMQLAGQNVVVVGGAAGIGHAIASAFAEEKARIVILDIVPEVETVAEGMRRNHAVACLGLSVDVTDFEAMKSAA